MEQLKFGMIALNIIVGSFILASGNILFAIIPFTAAYVWSRYEV